MFIGEEKKNMELHSVFLSLVFIFCHLFLGILLLFYEKLLFILSQNEDPTESAHLRIVDGTFIDIQKIPFMLSLRFNGKHICGAAIIGKSWGLTAAHCVTTIGIQPQNYSVRSGSTYKDKGGRIERIMDIVVHELYNVENSDYDMAVFKVKKPFRISKTTKPITLPGKSPVPDDLGVVAGWGYFTNYAKVLSPRLEYVVVPKFDRNGCAQNYAGRFELTPSQVCYGFKRGGKDACKGDSGGPIFTNSNILLGITSWGDGCGESESPGVFVTIFLMLDWIYEKTGIKSTL